MSDNTGITSPCYSFTMSESDELSSQHQCKSVSAKSPLCRHRVSKSSARASWTSSQRDVLKTVISLSPWAGMTSSERRGVVALRVISRVTSRWLCGVLLVVVWSLGRADDYKTPHNAMSYRPFQGMGNILEVDCTGDGADILTVSLYDPRSHDVIASANLKTSECTTSTSFSLCHIGVKGHQTKVVTLVQDLAVNERRSYGCNVTIDKAGKTMIRHWKLHIKAEKIRITTISMLPSTLGGAGVLPADKDSTPVARGSTDYSSEVYSIHPGILVTCLLFLLCFIALSIVLIVLQIRERRRRHYLAEEYDTPLPIKSEYAVPGGAPRVPGEKERILAAGGRYPRIPSTSSPLPRHVRKGSGAGSGGGGSLRYQQTGGLRVALHDEGSGYLAGPSLSVYYAEPWNGGDGDTRPPERIRPILRTPALHHTPPLPHHDIKACSSAPPPEDKP